MSGIPDGLKGVMTYRLRTASLGHTVVPGPPSPQVRTEPRALRLLSKRSTTQPPVVLLDL